MGRAVVRSSNTPLTKMKGWFSQWLAQCNSLSQAVETHRQKEKGSECAVALEPFPSHKVADMPRRVGNYLPDDLLLGLTDFLKEIAECATRWLAERDRLAAEVERSRLSFLAK